MEEKRKEEILRILKEEFQKKKREYEKLQMIADDLKSSRHSDLVPDMLTKYINTRMMEGDLNRQWTKIANLERNIKALEDGSANIESLISLSNEEICKLFCK